MKIILSLQGLSCMHCVGSVTKALQARSDVESVNVTIDYAVIESSASPESLIKTIEDAGYEAAEATTANVELALSGLNCMKCAGKTQQALEAVEGVAAAVVDTQQAKVYGTASAADLIAAVDAAGFKAELAQSGISSPKN